VANKAGGQVPDPVTERVRGGVPEFGLVVEADEAGPGGEVGGDVRGEDPAAVDFPGLRRKIPESHGLGGADAAGPGGGVVALEHVDELGVLAAGHAGHPGVGMFVQVMEYFQPAFFSKAVMFFLWRRDGFTRRAMNRSPSGQSSALLMRWVISAQSLSSSSPPSWSRPGCQALPGRAAIASSSAGRMVQPQVNSIVMRFVDRESRCFTRSWLAPAPSSRIRILRRNAAGTCLRAAVRTSLWPVKVFDPALPGRRSMARHSLVFASQAPSGWKP
jgi:hypothetical protein